LPIMSANVIDPVIKKYAGNIVKFAYTTGTYSYITPRGSNV